MKAILSHLGIIIVGLDDFPQIGEIEETGSTLLENSLIKARTVHEITGLPSMADDTGLEVDALDGAPGVYSARYAGNDPSFEDNINKLLFELKGVPLEKRNARFRTVLSFVNGNEELISEGVIEGIIINGSRGASGFGYHPIFQPNSYNKTFAEMGQDEKNLIRHRSLALEKIKNILEPYLKKGDPIG